MSAGATLTAELRAEVKILEEDLRQRLAALPDVKKSWDRQWKDASTVGRTAISWEEWSSERITQAAVAWVLTTVFIRFAEDNSLIKPVWISGPPARRAEALNAQSEFMRTRAQAGENPTDRDWLLKAVDYLSGLPAARELVDETSALWLITPSGDAAGRLLAFWRERDEAGELRRDLRDEKLDTRFLGDIYQDLSEEAKSRYALLQTPDFVERFILDRTLEPALKERPLEGFKVIDPTCGSGHFLLGAFERLRERWEEHAAGVVPRARVQKALDAIHGVDLNPFAVAIARFRLTIAALQAAGETSLDAGNPVVFKLNLAAGDSLLHGLDQQEFDYGAEHHADRTAGNHAYPTENLAALRRILDNGQYDVVVGNPPYITVKDKALNAAYRDRYKYLKGTYALTVPFMERFFALAKSGERAGWVGQITSNSFMKREFGAPLIEKFFPTKDLRLVADTSGAYIPGHGTPTVILVGRNHRPTSETVRAILGVRGEPSRPEVPAKGMVWAAITEYVDEPGHTDDWVTVADLLRRTLAVHPWSLSGGGAGDVAEAIAASSARVLGKSVSSVGRTTATGADDLYFTTAARAKALGLTESTRGIVVGDLARDFTVSSEVVWWPYKDMLAENPISLDSDLATRILWPMRSLLRERVIFGQSIADRGVPWVVHLECYSSKLANPLGIFFAFVATHNHFSLNRSGFLSNRTAPVIKLPERATEDDHLALLGVLNSSTACFWLKQNSHDKGSQGVNEGVKAESWERFYEFTGTTMKDFPLPSRPVSRGRLLDNLAQRLSQLAPQAVVEAGIPVREALKEAYEGYLATRAQMIAQQEELDWEVYRLYGLVDEDLTYAGDDLPELALGERAFEIVLAWRMRDGEEQTAWFARHGSTPLTEIPQHWPAAYRELVQRRIELIASHPYLKLLERPENKRRWAAEPWEKQEERALRAWLLDRLEDRRLWFDHSGAPMTRSVAQLADDVARDADMASVLTLWEGRPDVPVATSLEKLLAREAVPYLAAYRYKESGLRKRAAWEDTWAMQRREDAGEKLKDPIPVPPKYTSADFLRKEYWDNRGKLDVPKERFILYPDTTRETDPSPVLGWAGWDHAQQAFALDQLIIQGETDGWPDERLIPLVAGLSELQPWVEQWHQEADDFYGGESAANTVRQQLDERMQQVERTREQLAAWRPQPARRGRRAAR
ncbi:BREX-2 system adenine-specific DNA-methyltransferase PglX [Actinoplanes oblitus]|uniref:site-specific DNA-methyltransferase (adenine-specific) n=1 Tax=Actinoplanes oblitus TaxID=3040509 RepID=A0ABY8WGK5_9ACTN|nr:BREX-2 system adenine-specific DNA-methyltransferase PglX [Actinoplanes oblitus]WIM97001.1 BREX-2 system adenine-specific DNA-methyltransferase PglX [Actinoplanes oblitus]